MSGKNIYLKEYERDLLSGIIFEFLQIIKEDRLDSYSKKDIDILEKLMNKIIVRKEEC